MEFIIIIFYGQRRRDTDRDTDTDMDMDVDTSEEWDTNTEGHRGVDAPEEYGRPTTVLPRHGHHILPSAPHLVHQIRTAR